MGWFVSHINVNDSQLADSVEIDLLKAGVTAMNAAGLIHQGFGMIGHVALVNFDGINVLLPYFKWKECSSNEGRASVD